MDEGKLWDYVIKWGIAQNPSLPPDLDKWLDEHFLALKNSLQNCLPLIHYFQISGEDIFDKGKVVGRTQKTLAETLTKDNTHSETVLFMVKVMLEMLKN
ncbi:hypothetical protein C2G38_2253294 [Gigaspora rosea]|uniref:Uncharacterized protein n=1 Tax=Gigaspora rosea TaxID=44941 RepID=A0A397U7P9_9GLOM|nr:hypothetical protein C2G38_2253294 [Gigaspora rosea]